MRSLILFFVFLLFLSCRSMKETSLDSVSDTDSVARSMFYRTVRTVDTVVRSTEFTFDTLRIFIERPSEIPDKPSETISVTAVKGHAVDRSSGSSHSSDRSIRVDTVAVARIDKEVSHQRNSATKLYEPPDNKTIAAIIAVLAILVLTTMSLSAFIIKFFLRKK